MLPLLFQIVVANPAVTALLGVNPTRCYPWGEVPQNCPKPYAVWQIISGNPENYLDSPTDMDGVSIQIDVYSDIAASTISVAKALRTAIESQATLTAFRQWPREPDTRLYRWQLDVDFFVER